MKLKTLAFIAASSVVSVSAYAQTEYNLDIVNTANLSYNSGNDPRTATSNIVTFKVDRKVTFNLSGTNTDRTVEPGQVESSTYTLTNLSNAPIAYTLSQPAAANVTYIIDDDGTPGISFADTRVTSLANPTTAIPIALETGDGITTSQTIYVEIVTADAAVDGETTDYILTATAVEPLTDNVGIPGTAIVPTIATEAWTQNVVQTVVDNSAASANNQGILRTGTGTYTVGAAIIALVKSVQVLSDPITNPGGAATTPGEFPKAIPGAVVEYTLTVNNTGSAAATVDLTDLLSVNFIKTATIASVLVDGIAPATTPTLVADGGTVGFDELLTVPAVTVAAFDSAYQTANPTATEVSLIVTFEVVLE
jgi:uncharacterized repeat protein (TIGR01451 family)